MTFKQFDINLNRFKYVIEDSGMRVINKRLFSATERFVNFENIGSEIIKVKERKLVWLITSVLFFILALVVLNRRINGGKIGVAAEFFWLAISTFFFIIYTLKRRNSIFLVNDDQKNNIEFIGTKIYENRLNQFIKQLFQRRDDYLRKNILHLKDLP